MSRSPNLGGNQKKGSAPTPPTQSRPKSSSVGSSSSKGPSPPLPPPSAPPPRDLSSLEEHFALKAASSSSLDAISDKAGKESPCTDSEIASLVRSFVDLLGLSAAGGAPSGTLSSRGRDVSAASSAASSFSDDNDDDEVDDDDEDDDGDDGAGASWNPPSRSSPGGAAAGQREPSDASDDDDDSDGGGGGNRGRGGSTAHGAAPSPASAAAHESEEARRASRKALKKKEKKARQKERVKAALTATASTRGTQGHVERLKDAIVARDATKVKVLLKEMQGLSEELDLSQVLLGCASATAGKKSSAADVSARSAVLKLLLSHGGGPPLSLLQLDAASGKTALHAACALGDESLAASILAGVAARPSASERDGALQRTCGDSGWTALHYAAACGFHDIAANLIKFGANPNAETDRGLTCHKANGGERDDVGESEGLKAHQLVRCIYQGKAADKIECRGNALSAVTLLPLTGAYVRQLEKVFDLLTSQLGLKESIQDDIDAEDEDDDDDGNGYFGVVADNSGGKSKKKKRSRKKKGGSLDDENGDDEQPTSDRASPSSGMLSSGSNTSSPESDDNQPVDPLIPPLLAMGFSELQCNAAIRALGGTGLSSADDLVAWIFEHGDSILPEETGSSAMTQGAREKKATNAPPPQTQPAQQLRPPTNHATSLVSAPFNPYQAQPQAQVHHQQQQQFQQQLRQQQQLQQQALLSRPVAAVAPRLGAPLSQQPLNMGAALGTNPARPMGGGPQSASSFASYLSTTAAASVSASSIPAASVPAAPMSVAATLQQQQEAEVERRRLAAEKEKQRQINRAWNSQQAVRQREEAAQRAKEEIERKKKAEEDKLRMKAEAEAQEKARQAAKLQAQMMQQMQMNGGLYTPAMAQQMQAGFFVNPGMVGAAMDPGFNPYSQTYVPYDAAMDEEMYYVDEYGNPVDQYGNPIDQYGNVIYDDKELAEEGYGPEGDEEQQEQEEEVKIEVNNFDFPELGKEKAPAPPPKEEKKKSKSGSMSAEDVVVTEVDSLPNDGFGGEIRATAKAFVPGNVVVMPVVSIPPVSDSSKLPQSLSLGKLSLGGSSMDSGPLVPSSLISQPLISPPLVSASLLVPPLIPSSLIAPSLLPQKSGGGVAPQSSEVDSLWGPSGVGVPGLGGFGGFGGLSSLGVASSLGDVGVDVGVPLDGVFDDDLLEGVVAEVGGDVMLQHNDGGGASSIGQSRLAGADGGSSIVGGSGSSSSAVGGGGLWGPSLGGFGSGVGTGASSLSSIWN